jgi:hypothetical protein
MLPIKPMKRSEPAANPVVRRGMMNLVALLLIVKLTPLACPPGTKQHRRAEEGRIDEQWCADSHGRRHGPHAFYYDNGQRIVQELYTYGVQDGLTEYFFNDGTVWRSEEWKHGKKLSEWINPIVYKLTKEQAKALGAASCGGTGVIVKSAEQPAARSKVHRQSR